MFSALSSKDDVKEVVQLFYLELQMMGGSYVIGLAGLLVAMWF